MNIRRSVLACIALFPAAASAALVTDDFNDGNANGWTTSNPIGTGSFSVVSGAYRIATAATPNPAFGPGRAGSFRNDASETNFAVLVDLVDWDAAQVEMVAGLLARVSQIGAGTTDGYGLVVEPDEGLSLVRITNEASAGLGVGSAAPLTLTPGNDYRMAFTGSGTSLTGQIFDLTNLAVPLATVTATDATYASGVPGVFVFDSSAAPFPGTARADFDNFLSVPEPSVAALGLAGLLLAVRRRRA